MHFLLAIAEKCANCCLAKWATAAGRSDRHPEMLWRRSCGEEAEYLDLKPLLYVPDTVAQRNMLPSNELPEAQGGGRVYRGTGARQPAP